MGVGQGVVGKDHSTKKIGYGVFSGKDKKREYAEEAVILVWHEQWEKTKLKNSGHAAMKLKQMANTPPVCDYVSWWPATTGADKDTPRQKGQSSDKYRSDESSEIKFSIQLLLYLDFLWEALAEASLSDRTQVFQEIWRQCQSRDAEEGLGLIARFERLGFEWGFENFEKLKGTVQQKGNQKRFKGTEKLYDKTGLLDTLKNNEGSAHEQIAKQAMPADGQLFGKRPTAKIYLPCSTLPSLLDDTYTQIWGLSLEGMRCSWQAFTAERDAQYEMKSHKINCASVVWRRLVDGYGECFTNMVLAIGVKNLARGAVSFVPSDLIRVGEALDSVFKRMNAQQELLDKMALTNREAVQGKFKGLMKLTAAKEKKKEDEIDAQKVWRNILIFDYWRELSKSQGSRFLEVGTIDKALGKYETARKALSVDEEHRLAQTILDDLEKLKKLKGLHDDATLKLEQATGEHEVKLNEARDNLDEATTRDAVWKCIDVLRELAADHQLLSAKRNKAYRKDQEELTLALIQKNLAFLAEKRGKMITQLVAIHNAVHSFAKKHQKHPRLPAILLLGQCAAYAYWESAQVGQYIGSCALSPDESHVLIPCVTRSLSDEDKLLPILGPTPEGTESLKGFLDEMKVKEKKAFRKQRLKEGRFALSGIGRQQLTSLLKHKPQDEE